MTTKKGDALKKRLAQLQEDLKEELVRTVRNDQAPAIRLIIDRRFDAFPLETRGNKVQNKKRRVPAIFVDDQ